MKIQALIAAVLLATGSAYAQAPNDTAKAPADTTAKQGASADAKSTAKAGKKKSKKVSKKSATQTMGAGAPVVDTDLNAADRQARMDQAYANWKAGGTR